MNDDPTRVLPDPPQKPDRLDAKQRQQLTRVAILVTVALLLVTFIFRNTRQVPVSFIVFTTRASLIWVIFSSMVLGFIAGWLLPGQIRRWRERRRSL